MARLAASLEALFWGLHEYNLEQVSEIVLVEWISQSVTKRVCDAPELNRFCHPISTHSTQLSTSEAITIRILTIDQEKTAAFVQPALTRVSEVHSLNAAAQRARGCYLLRLDQDTIVAPSFMRFLQTEMASSWPHIHQPWFGGRRDCDDAASEDLLEDPVHFLLQVEKEASPVDWQLERVMGGPVGVLGVPAWLWRAIRGYDERYVAWGHMELEMYSRLSQVTDVMPLSNYTDMTSPFFHIAHNKSTSAEPVRQINSFHDFTKSKDRMGVSRSNSRTWGLASMHIPEQTLKSVQQDLKS